MPGERFITLSAYPWQARVFGLVFALLGLCGVTAMFSSRAVPPQVIKEPDGTVMTIPGSSPADDAWIPGIFLVIGLGIALVRYRQVLDADRHVRVTTGGWGPLVKRWETALEGVTSIDVVPAEERGTGSGRFTAYPVKATGSAVAIELAVAKSGAQARAIAQRIAAALNLPLGADLGAAATSGTSAAGVAGDALDADAASAGLPVAPAAAMARPTQDELRPPDGTAVRTEDRARGIAIRFPMMRRGAVGVVMAALMPLLLLTGFWYVFWRPATDRISHSHEDRSAQVGQIMFYAPLLLGAVPLVIALGAAFRSGVLGGTIRVDSQEGLRAAGHSVTPERIQAIEVLPTSQQGGGLKIVLESSSFVIARGQGQIDLLWIRALILEHLKE